MGVKGFQPAASDSNFLCYPFVISVVLYLRDYGIWNNSWEVRSNRQVWLVQLYPKKCLQLSSIVRNQVKEKCNLEDNNPPVTTQQQCLPQTDFTITPVQSFLKNLLQTQ